MSIYACVPLYIMVLVEWVGGWMDPIHSSAENIRTAELRHERKSQKVTNREIAKSMSS